MPDLHEWISQKIDAAEQRAQACPPWPWTFDADWEEVKAADGIVVADVFALSGRQLRATGEFIAANDPAAALRRCTADRKILARHNVNPAWADWPSQAVACYGCGVESDCDWPVTENINDCPELLDIAEGYGLTADEHAQLDRPAPPPRKTCTSGKTLGQAIADVFDEFTAVQLDETFLGNVTAHKFTGLMPIAVELLPPTPIQRALDILGPHLQDEPLYRPTA
ncbi:DUF6221 family protein [Streptomyces virginiae]|uniref:DUF6221 family protein n=1 Tax=Streptomyces virginiae TaxID=1961 RepID=UPI0022551C76|nr:DUF6221 family protein [Streptomyces virginiae]MCX5176750.1 DUF6221 family protein [Streptomyces virginiae]